jgi:hypothetical protein
MQLRRRYCLDKIFPCALLFLRLVGEFAVSEYLPKDVRGALAALDRSGEGGEKGTRNRPRMRLVANGREYRVLRRWTRGFAVALADAPQLRGLVDLYDGERHLCKALVLASRDEEGERLYEFKFANTAIATPPAVDFARGTGFGEG